MQDRAAMMNAIMASVKASVIAFSFDKAALFPFFVDDVQSIERRFDAAISAPQRHDETNEEADTQSAVWLSGKAV